MTDRPESRLEGIEHLFLIQIRELLAEAFQVAEGMFIDKAHQIEQLQQGVLQRRRREQQLGLAGQRQLECVGNHVLRLVHVTQAVRLIDHHEIPGHGMHIACFAFGKLIGADDDFRTARAHPCATRHSSVLGISLERAKLSLFDCCIVGF